MASDFFQRQGRARRQTLVLVGWLALAVAAIVVVLNAVGYLIWIHGLDGFPLAHAAGERPRGVARWLAEPWWMVITVATVLVVGAGSFRRYLDLRGGGTAVAELVGARRVEPHTGDERERMLVNVTEEMAIAAGTPVPEIYLLDREPGINAFVAGFEPNEAVLVVTRGALVELDRDQLQGVVGHEFSHILNGDMRLNVRLMALLNGILALGIIGRIMTRGALGGSGRRRGGGHPLLLALGLALIVLGYLGVLLGRMIKAAVSRHRELLADASAVQFTRNPGGLAGALWRIREGEPSSLLRGARAEETSHMCFAGSMRYWPAALFATHPPIDERIRAVDPSWFGKMAARRIRAAQAAREARARSPAPAPGSPAGPAAAGTDAGAGGFLGGLSAAVLAASVGTVRPEHLEFARALRARLPEELLAAAHDPARAPALVLALLLGDVDPEQERVALALLRHRAGEETAATATRLRVAVAAQGDAGRLPLLDLALPALRHLDPEARERLVDTADRLARFDRRVTLFQLSLLVLLRKHLDPHAGHARAVRHVRYEPVTAALAALLSLIARAGSDDETQAATTFARAAAGFTGQPLALLPAAECRPEAMGGVLAELAALSPILKRPIIEACADAVLADGRVRVAEAELLRAIADALDCPMPPLVPVARIAGGI